VGDDGADAALGRGADGRRLAAFLTLMAVPAGPTEAAIASPAILLL
jgi:hypothetical protein